MFLEDLFMKRKLFLIMFILGLLTLAACGENNDDQHTNDNENETEPVEKPDSNEDEEIQDEVKEVNEVIVDNDNVHATLVEIERKEDIFFDEVYNVVFEVENKLDHNIEVQARSVSADGEMIDETILAMSQDIAPGKKAKAVLQILNMESYDFPEMKENFEMTLHIFSFENFDYTEDHPVKVQF